MSGKNSGVCAIDGCDAPAKYRGWCSKHYGTWYRHGNPLHPPLRRASGSGTAAQHGYIVYGHGSGKKSYEHVHVAERAIGKALPPGAEVHHVDGSGLNNAGANLVVCPNHAYHMLLHRRQRALDACGHADYSRCWICGQWDAPDALTFKKGRAQAFHAECWARYHAAGNLRRKAARNATGDSA